VWFSVAGQRVHGSVSCSSCHFRRQIRYISGMSIVIYRRHTHQRVCTGVSSPLSSGSIFSLLFLPETHAKLNDQTQKKITLVLLQSNSILRQINKGIN